MPARSPVSTIPEARLQGLYDGEDFGGERTERARVIRRLIDEIRVLQTEGPQARRERTRTSDLPEERLARLYEADGYGGGGTLRARVVRELIDAIRSLRAERE